MTIGQTARMYFSVIEAAPKFGTEAFSKYDGAHIACWINTVQLTEGRKKARALVEQSGWFLKQIKEEKIISSDDCPKEEDGMRYFNQALTDGEVCVVYTFPQSRQRN